MATTCEPEPRCPECDPEIVPVGCECPACGEDDMGEIVWDDDDTYVRCETCGTCYTPPTGKGD